MIDVESLKKLINEGNNFKYHLFWGGPFSNWHKAPFTLNGINYYNTEQHMMANKAKVFNDKEIYNKIMQTSDPEIAKGLGRSVKGFKGEIWDQYKIDIVREGNLAKFKQNITLGEYLKNTNDDIIVEASPYDRIWGIGLGKYNSNAKDPFKWKGENLLGFILMEVREILQNE